MLVLSRRLNDAILIGDDIKLTVVRLTKNTVRLGIEAPSDVNVIREELDQKDPATVAVTIENVELL